VPCAVGELVDGYIDQAHASEDIAAKGWVRAPLGGRRSAGEQHGGARSEFEAHGDG
jgi:hypothetical protein